MKKELFTTKRKEKDCISSCRYYENDFPDENECVIVQYETLTPYGIIVKLLEYDGIEGMVVTKEISSKTRDTSRSKLQAKIGKVDVCKVLSVDSFKRYIDLSRKNVEEEEKLETNQFYAQTKILEKLLCETLLEVNGSYEHALTMKDVFPQLIWPLYTKDYSHPIDALQLLLSNSGDEQVSRVKKLIEFPDERFESIFLRKLKAKFELKEVNWLGHVHVECFHFRGILAIKEAFKNVQRQMPGLIIKILSSPEYSLEFRSSDEEFGKKQLHLAAERIQKELDRYGGTCEKTNPFIWNDLDDDYQ